MKSKIKTIVGVDTGGTFTDFILLENGTTKLHKVPSTPKNPAQAILRGLKELKVTPNQYHLIHGSTVATNAFLERKGAKIALITTHGFKDMIEIGRQDRKELYNLDMAPLPPLVSPSNRFEVEERIDYQGKVLTPLNLNQVKKLYDKLKKKKIDAVAISFLFSYVNNRHEKEIKEALKNLSLPISLSSEILPEFREYERSAATVLNASLSPIMSRYLDTLESKVEAKRVQVMQSNGGIISVTSAKKEPIRTLLSGPAGGVVGATHIARQAGFKKVITFDMGGTSTDVCLVDGAIKTTSSTLLEGIPISVPMMPIHTVGAGGGSLASVDPGGALQVGPQSAGADPGPICYGKGKSITITDAHLYLGRIHPRTFLGGKMTLSAEKIKEPINRLAKELQLKPRNCAEGIIEIANTHMENAIRVISTQKGFDPREFTLVPFGGAGGLHACEMARHLGIPQILVPQNPGILSALGMALSPTIKDYSKTVLLKENSSPIFQKLKNRYEPLKKQALLELKKEGVMEKEIQLKPTLDLRYQGQSFEINVPFSSNFKSDFFKAHRTLYGYIHKDQPIEIVTLRLTAIGNGGTSSRSPLQESKNLSKKKTKPVSFDIQKFFYEKKSYMLPFYWRDQFSAGSKIKGPAVICEFSATTFIPPDFKGSVDGWGNLILNYGR